MAPPYISWMDVQINPQLTMLVLILIKQAAKREETILFAVIKGAKKYPVLLHAKRKRLTTENNAKGLNINYDGGKMFCVPKIECGGGVWSPQYPTRAN